MVVLIAKGTQQSSRKVIFRDAVYDAVRKLTVISIQKTKKECIAILSQKKVRLVNDETSTRNPNLSTGIYLSIAKVAQYRLASKNRKEKE